MTVRGRSFLLSCLAFSSGAVGPGFGQSVYTTPYTFTTAAGVAQVTGSANGTNGAAQFYYPVTLAVDRSGNLFITDTYNHTIRKATPVGTNWVVSTIAGLAGSDGSANGTNSDARFFRPYGVAVDAAGAVFVSDTLNNTIRKITPVGTNWVVSTLAGSVGFNGSANGTNDVARFDGPNGLAVDNVGNIFVADLFNATIRKLTPVGTNWVVTTIAGLAGNQASADGTNSDARFNFPVDVDVDTAGNVFVADFFNSTIRKITPVGTNWVVTTVAGSAGITGSTDATGSAARFNNPRSVAVDSAGNLHMVDAGNNSIRKITPSGEVSTLAGVAGSGNEGSANGVGSAARFYDPRGIAVDNAGTLYVADYANHTIRKGAPPAGFPAFTLHPQSQFFRTGAGVTLSATADGTGALGYQWLLNGVNITNATNATLQLTNLTATSAGGYSLVAGNAMGTIASQAAAFSFFGDLGFYSANAGTTLAGPLGALYRVDYADVLANAINWVAMTNLSLFASPIVVLDPQSSARTIRFYRAGQFP